MNYSPYTPNYQFNPMPYQIAIDEKHQIRKTVNRVCWTILAAVLLLPIVINILTIIYARNGYFIYSITDTAYGMPLVLFYLITDLGYIAMAIPPLVYFFANRIPLNLGIPFRKMDKLTAAACVFFGIAVCQLANIPANYIAELEKYFGYSGTLPQSPLSNDPIVLILYFICFTIIAPLVEELIFRGAVLQSLRRFGGGFAAFVSALLFGLYHGNFIQGVFAFFAGLVMAYVDLRTNSLLPSLIIHFSNNFIASLLDVLQRNFGNAAVNRIEGYVFFALMLAGALSLAFLITKKEFFKREKSYAVLPFSDKCAAMFSNPGAVAILIYFVILSVNMLKY